MPHDVATHQERNEQNRGAEGIYRGCTKNLLHLPTLLPTVQSVLPSACLLWLTPSSLWLTSCSLWLVTAGRAMQEGGADAAAHVAKTEETVRVLERNVAQVCGHIS